MTMIAQLPKQRFRLSKLIYDTRYRAKTIQIITFIGFVLLIAWLVHNTAQNLAASGKELSFSFLFEPAGYEINQHLIAYSPENWHIRAAVVGLLNTLLVAGLGCVTATILGVLIGILRLSDNWVISRLMTFYVEMFRNVPLLLWIVLSMAILTEVLPPPSAFRGENPAATMSFFHSVAVTNRGVYIPAPLFSRGLGDFAIFGDVFSLSLDFLLLLAILLGGFFTSHLIKVRADRIQEATGERPRTFLLRLSVVVLPMLAAFWGLGFHLEYPVLKGFNFRGGIFIRNSLLALWIALSLYTASFIAEIVRSGILAISKGQSEAAAALGLRQGKIMRLIILPQALRVIIPPLISQYLSLTKNSSLAIAVGYLDLTGTLMGITLNQTGRELETVLLGMLVYLAISLSVSAVMNWYNKRVKLVER